MRAVVRQVIFTDRFKGALNLTIKTDNIGSANNTIVLPFSTLSKTKISWGDGSIEPLDQAGAVSITHQYLNIGEHRIRILGGMRLIFNNSGDRLKVVLITGNLPESIITNGSGMFFGCGNMQGFLPQNLSSLTNGSNMFRSCTSLAGAFPSNLGALIDGQAMFYECVGLTGNVTQNLSKLVIGSSMFFGCGNATGSPPVSLGVLTNGSSMFQSCTNITGSFPQNLSSLIDGSNMFRSCASLTGSFPVNLSVLTNGFAMFLDCPKATGNFPANLNSLTNASFMFNGCILGTYPSGMLSTVICANWSNAFTGCSINQTGVNAMMADLRTTVTAGRVAAASLIFNANGGTSATPTGQGLTDKNFLISQGATITTN